LLLIVTMAAVQRVLNSVLYGINNTRNLNANVNMNMNSGTNREQGYISTSSVDGNSDNSLRGQQQQQQQQQQYIKTNSYDSLMKNTINYDNNNNNNEKNLQDQINNLRSQISALQSSQSQKIADDPRFFPFVIRDSRHLTPVQVDPDFHVFDYVDLTQALQPRSRHTQLLHNARIVIDDQLEAKRNSKTYLAAQTAAQRKSRQLNEKYEAPCQGYSIKCYRQKILQIFSYVLRTFPSVDYYFYVEADNDLCVPMSMVKDLALTEERYFINTGIGFSGWIMSREFLNDFIGLYANATLDQKVTVPKPGTTTNETITVDPEIRPDVLASYYLTDREAWTVTRQYWVSHTTLESLGVASLTVKDRRTNQTGERLKLEKHLPRCLEPRRGKWKVSRRKPYLDPRDRFGWDYFDYDVCPNEMIFPCKGQDQLKQLVADDLRVATETGAIVHWKQLAEKRKKRNEALVRQKMKAALQQQQQQKKQGNKEAPIASQPNAKEVAKQNFLEFRKRQKEEKI